MGNLVFRYFIEWLRVEMREAYKDYVEQARRRLKSLKKAEAVAQKQQQKQQHQGTCGGLSRNCMTSIHKYLGLWLGLRMAFIFDDVKSSAEEDASKPNETTTTTMESQFLLPMIFSWDE